MASEIGSVAVRVGANIEDLKKGMSEGSRSVGRFSSKAGTHFRKTVTDLAKVGAAAAAAGAALTASLYVKGAQVIDKQAKLARQLGTTQASIAAMTRAADLAGVAQGQLESNIQAYNKRLGEAIDGTGEAKGALDKLGLSARELSQMPLDDQMALIAERINGLGTASEKAAVASDLFSRSGLNMINLFEGGAEGIKAARKEAEQFGLAVTDVEASQIEAANDAMTSIKATIQGVANTIAVQLSPYIQEIGQRFGDASKGAGGFRSQVSSVIEGALKGFGKLGDSIHGIRIAFKGLELIAVSFGAAVVTAIELALKGVEQLVGGSLANLRKVGAALSVLPGVGRSAGQALAQLGNVEMQTVVEGADSLRNSVVGLRGELSDLAMQELPSDKIEQFLADVAQRSQETAAQVVAARNQMVTMPENEMGGGDDAEKEKQEKALEAIRQRYMTEQELLREHREQMALIGEEYDAAKFETEEEWRSIREQAEQDHMDKLAKIRQDGMTKIQKFQAMSMQGQLQTVTGALANMTAGVANENKRMFEINKKAGIANAIISAYQGISTTLGAYPAPLSFAMAAVQAAAAFAQVNAIRSQSFGSGGGVAPSLAGGTPAPPTTNVNGGTPQGGGGQTMRVEGLDKNSLFGGDAVQTIAQGLLDFQKDGGQVVFAG